MRDSLSEMEYGKRVGDAVRVRIPLFLRPIVGRMRFLAPLALRDSATVSSDFVALPHLYAFRRLRIAAPFDLMEMRRGGSVLLPAFILRGALGIEQGDFVRYIGTRAA